MQDKFLGMTPPLGWNSWNTFTWNINDLSLIHIYTSSLWLMRSSALR